MHRLWAGTKLVSVGLLAVVVSVEPSWPAIGLFALLLSAATRSARVPLGAVPRPPGVFLVLMLLGAVLTLVSGGEPEVAVGGVHVGFGDLELYVRFTCLALVVLWASAMVTWTTPLGEIGPALACLWSPLRRVRVPVDEWAVTVALCVRSLPLLVDEMRVLLAARRLRSRPAQRRTADDIVEDLVDTCAAVLAASVRRAGEMGEAITARGGVGGAGGGAIGPVGHRRRADAVRRHLSRADATALTVVVAVAAAGVVLSVVP